MTMMLGPLREGAAPAVPKAKPAPTAEQIAEEARRQAPVRLRDHEARPEEEAKESTREVAAPVAKAAPEQGRRHGRVGAAGRSRREASRTA